MPGAVFQSGLSNKGYQQIVAATLATAQTLTIPTGATMAVVQAETGNIRYRSDGTAPTTSVGMILAAGDSVPVFGQADLAAFQAIGDGATSILNIDYFGLE